MFNKELLDRHIMVDQNIQHGKPCIKGTRTPVHIILEALATGMDFKAIEREFAPITIEDIQACILFAALLANEQEFITQPA